MPGIADARRVDAACRDLPPRLDVAYRRTCYRAGGVTLQIGRRSAAADVLLSRYRARTAVLLTAWNPGSRRMLPGWNQRMQRALAVRLRGYRLLEGEGQWRGWREAHLLAIGAVPPLARLAWRFRQRAVVVLAHGRPVRLVVALQLGASGTA